MRFGILGTVEARRPDGRPVELGSPKLRALLTLLLLDAGRVVPPERLIDGVYGAAPPQGAANALQSQVSRLRRRLAASEDDKDTARASTTDTDTASPVEFHPGGYRIAVHPDEVDAHRFERLAARGRCALADGDNAAAASLLSEALELWRGPALDDLGGFPSAHAATHRLDELWLEATEDHAEAELGLGRQRELLPRLRELIAARPLRERPRALLVRALTADGQRAEALAAFEDARSTLADELGADPSEELSAAHLAALSDESAPVAVAPLPAPVSSFVGRSEELERLRALLARDRLVTLTGMGGIGKTRLAVEAVRGSVRDGEVCFVALSAVTDGEHVAQAVVTALGLREAGARGQPVADPGRPGRRRSRGAADAARPGQLRARRRRGGVARRGCSPPAPPCASWPPAASRSASPARAWCP